ncbi:MAG: hypothetical protein RQ743_01270 [Bacteroidales bacterium]|nr:hypothetical protein [Bacteroidales bacterium]
MEVIRVRITGEQTLVDMSIQNQVRDGYFCIDENTYIKCGDGTELKMQEAKGLPACPEIYEFRSVGEKVYFTLVFDKLPDNTAWFDIVEYCDANCFSVLALNLDEDINGKINKAFDAMDRLDPEEAIRIFKDMLPAMKESGHGLTGSVYLNLIELLDANKRNDELHVLVSDFKASPMPHKQGYLEILSTFGY